MTAQSRPLVSLVVACYGVEEYLPDFVRSVEPQMSADVEVVLVIDGSPDASASIAHDWARRSQHRVTVIEQENQGVSGARNTGLDVAVGDWVAFPDPDDILGPRYLEHVLARLRAHDAVDGSLTLVSTNVVPVLGNARVVLDDHPLRYKYRGGARTVTLGDHPEMIQLATHTAFMRVAVLREHGIRFDGAVRPVFEDAHLVARYLLAAADPTVALLPRARYLYRRRDDGSSLLGSVWTKAAKYDDVLRYGHLDLIRLAARRGAVPRWLQNTLLYDLVWYFKADARVQSETASLTSVQAATLHERLVDVLRGIDDQTIRDFSLVEVSEEIRAVLLAMKGSLPRQVTIRLGAHDDDAGLRLVSFYTALDGPGPMDLEFRVDGQVVAPVFAKRRAVKYLGTIALHEGLAWVPDGERFEARLHDQPLTVERGGSGQGVLASITPQGSRVRALLDGARRATHLARRDRRQLLETLVRLDVRRSRTVKPTLAQRLAGEGSAFRDCWLLIDRDTEAHDNAEHLYRYLRQHRPDINAWFVLRRHSPDWPRLSADGFRLIAHGSARHALALAQCRELISSQIDHYIVSPPVAIWMRSRPWRFTWLQHGVTQQDLSRWLNTKSPSLAVMTTPAETESFVADGTPYKWTTHEVALTGQPRHDELLRKANHVRSEERRSVVLMPTWRNALLSNAGSGNARRLVEGFWESAYARNWFGLLRSPLVRDVVAEAGLELVFMPHPTLAPHLTTADLPSWVRLATYASHDVQSVIAESFAVVTDYSSTAFDAAIADRPLLYFQFDYNNFFAGTHIGRPGYFDYAKDGFGPVVSTLRDAESAIAELVSTGPRVREPYASRASEAFPVRDGSSCERVVHEIETRRRPRMD